MQGGGHCIDDCTPTRDRGQSEVKRSRRIFEAGQAVKLGIGGSLRTAKVSPGDRWAWLMLDGRGSRPDFRCGQGVKHENLLGQDLDRGRGWKYRLCSIPPLQCTCTTQYLVNTCILWYMHGACMHALISVIVTTDGPELADRLTSYCRVLSLA